MKVEPRTNEKARSGGGTPERATRQEHGIFERITWFSSLAMHFTTSDGREQPKILEYIPVGAERAADAYGLAAYLGLEAFELFALMDTVEAEGFNLCLTPAGGVYQPRDEREYQEFMRRVMENGRPSEWTEGDQAKEEHRGREMQTVNNGPALPTRYAPESSPTAYMAMMRERGKADPDICAARRLAVKRFH